MKSQNLTSRRQEIISKPTSKSVYVRIERVQYICCYLLALEDGGCRKTSWSTWWSSPHQYLLHDASARSPWYIYIDILEAYIYPETADPTVHLNANRILYYIDTCAPDTPFMDSVWFSFSTSHSYCLPRALHQLSSLRYVLSLYVLKFRPAYGIVDLFYSPYEKAPSLLASIYYIYLWRYIIVYLLWGRGCI